MSNMQLIQSWRPPLLGSTALVCLLLFAAAPASAQQKAAASNEGIEEIEELEEPAGDAGEPEYSKYYTGAFVEYSLRGGASLATEGPYDGWHVDAGVRHSFPMLIGDFRVAYRYDNLDGGDAAGKLEQHGLGGYLALHPAYLLMLGSDWLSYTLSSIHLELGAGAKAGVLEPADGGDYETGFGPFVSLGGGFDVPIGDPDTGAAPWLNFVYRWHVADFDGEVETFDLDMHVLQVGLGWRINGLLF